MGKAVARALRQVRQCLIMALAERDISGAASLPEVCEAMTAFAATATRIALRQAGAELLEQFGGRSTRSSSRRTCWRSAWARAARGNSTSRRIST